MSTRRPPIPVHLRLQAAVTLVAVLTSGCLGHYYEVSRTELERLAREPPETRGQNVYAVQQFTTDAEPEPAGPWYPPQEGPPPSGYSMGLHGYWVPDFYIDFGAPYYDPPVYTRNSVHDASPVSGGVSGGSVGSGSSGGGSSGGGGSGNVGNVGEAIVVIIAVGVVVGVALAATEGARYEGSVAVHPQHPVHLWHRYGGQSTVRLDELTPEQLRDVERATLSGREGAGMWLRGAAPLNRAGFSYQFGAGEDRLTLPGGQDPRSLGFRFALGYYPVKRFGLLIDSRLQTGDFNGGDFYNVRLGMEAQWFPLTLWRLHLGPFLGGGQSWSASEGGLLPTTSGTRPYVSAGAIAEFEIATRLGLTARWNVDWMTTAPADTRRFVSTWSVGLSVY
ncbi:MAG TPA: hypothetical protein VFZ09_47610 [Archangium sp.]|uniref:hypothetical protein n=1 Tax=Archangium sp. TaxID=1872627 RepID=UPI002E30092B|nr:hypothetical protein [Archangium sp.]HEX5753944.1 hypothetical protein [Archangium sp.]